jgi:hypothetical protein
MNHPRLNPDHQAVEAFAAALDADDLTAAAVFLDPSCTYVVGDATHVGTNEVMASYRAGSELARRLFASVRYDHDPPIEIGPGSYRVRFVDELTAGGEIHIHVAVQDLSLRSGRIVRIVDHDLPAERAELDAFMRRHGIDRP